MTTEKMTIHKALAELKIIDDRIDRAIASTNFVVANKHSNTKIAGVTVQEFTDGMKSSYQKANDLINRRNAIKRAVVMSNAVTKVVVGGVEMTVAEAIEAKNHGMDFKKAMVSSMTATYNSARREFERNSGSELEERAEKYVLSVIQAQPKESKSAVDSDFMKTLKAQYISDNSYDIIDPLNIQEKISNLNDEITAFETEVDAALSVSNALTVIEISY